MPSFSRKSAERLATCHPHLQEVFNEVVKTRDCAVLCGRRGKEEQDQAVHDGKSKALYPNSRHNSEPSQAVDVMPWPINWSDKISMAAFAEFVIATAKERGIDIRWGGDWDGDGQWRDEKFLDMPHFELRHRV